MKVAGILVSAGILIASVSCADLTDFKQYDGGPGDAWQPPCTSGQTRCEGQSYQVCTAGSFKQVLSCDTSRVCVEGKGCLDCDPGEAKTCHNNNVHRCEKDGHVGAELQKCLGLPCGAGECRAPGCASGAHLVYVVDVQHRLFSFDPTAESNNHFKLIKKLTCPAQFGATPFSMSVDRSARAWVLYSSGELFWVDTKTGSCKTSPYAKGQGGYQLFGMGFVSDSPGSSKEKLYIAGAKDSTQTEKLATIDPGTLKITPVGQMPHGENSPELSGTGNAELYSYYPGISSTFVMQVNKTSGAEKQRWSVPSLPGQVTAWAFAHWGGKFYIFVTATSGLLSEKSQVLFLDPSTGKSSVFLASVPYKIVGAGVSTCAPVIE